MSTIESQREEPALAPRIPHRTAGHGLPGLVLRGVVSAGALAVVAGWWVGTPASAGTTPGGALTAASELAGLLAGFLVCVQLLLIGRVPWMERAVGLDRLVAWHRVLGATVVGLVVAHVVLVVVGGMLLDKTALWPEILALVATQPDLLSAIIGTALVLAVGMTSARLVRTRLPYEAWYAIHLTTYVGIYLAFGHQIHAGTHLVTSILARNLWIALYVATAASLLVWRVLVPLVAHSRASLRVVAVVPESTGMVSVWLGGRDLGRFAARGGQFFLVRFLTRGHLGTAHPYSVSIVPTAMHLRFTVAAHGDHSAALAHLRPGTRAIVEGPFGRFTADRARSARVLLVAGGAGIGPVRSLAEDLVRDGRDVVVLHRARSAEHLGLGGELAAASGLRYVPVPGRRAELGHDPLDARHLTALVPDIATRDVFVCGPPAMTDTVVASVHAAGVPRSAIHHEELSLS